MKKASHKLNYNVLAFVALSAIIIAGIVYWSISRSYVRRYMAERDSQYASTTMAFQQILSGQRAKISKIEQENKELTGLLTSEQTRRLELERAKENNEKQIDTLTKLTTIDPELIKKYSKVFFLSENYVPASLRDIDKKYLIDPTKSTQTLSNTYPFLKILLDSAESDKVSLLVTSAYRSFDYQKTLKSDYKMIYGAGTANQFSADQGYSEHQLGTAVDFVTDAVRSADIEFEDTPAFKWMNANAYKYGFVISYPKSNKYYEYEPWHWRFVGRQLAKDLHDKNEYFYEMDQREIDTYLIKLFD